MSDRRRRRRPAASESEQSETGDKRPPNSELSTSKDDSDCESEGDQAGSEYESATEENEEDDYTYTEEYTDDDSSVLIEDEYIEDDWVSEERQSGDGEEQPDETKSELDDDEDRKNPAFVPRKGNFYEHDTREGEEGTGGEPDGGEQGPTAPQKQPTEQEMANERKERKKKLWEEATRWDHDRYDDRMQAPKSREELIAQYGYDIRAHDQPPEAPPQRRGAPRGRRTENRPRFSDYMEGRFENPRVPRYGPKAVERGRMSNRARGSRGRGRGNGGRGTSRDPPGTSVGMPMKDHPGRDEYGQGDRNVYSRMKNERVDNTDDWNDYPRLGSSGNYSKPGRDGRGDGRGDEQDQERTYNQTNNRNMNRTSPGRNDGSPQQQSQPNRKNTYVNKTVSNDSYNNRYNEKNSYNNNDSRQPEDNRQYRQQKYDTRKTDQYTRGSGGGGNVHEQQYSNKSGPQDERLSGRNKRRSKSPDKKQQQQLDKTGASLENIMDIAPPLTTIETRTMATVGNVTADISGSAGEHAAKKTYSQDRRKATGRAREAERPEGQKKNWEPPEKPPRFREQEQAKHQAQNNYPQTAAPVASKPQQQQQPPVPQGSTVISVSTTAKAADGRPPPQTKRYSSQRQRNVPETSESNQTPPPPPMGVGLSTQTPVSVSQVQPITAVGVIPPSVQTQARIQQLPMQVSSPMLVASGNTGTVPTMQVPRAAATAIAVTIATTGPHQQMPQYFVAQQTGQVFRQATPVYGQVAPPPGISDPKNTAQYPGHILQQQQQALALQQGSAQRVSQSTVSGAPRLVYTATPPQPTPHVMPTGAGTPPRVIQAAPAAAQYIAATPMVNISSGAQIQHSGQQQQQHTQQRQQQQQHFQIAAAAAAGQIQTPTQLQAVPGQLPVQFAVPPPAVHQRTDVTASTSATKVGSTPIHLPTAAVAHSSGQGQGPIQGQLHGPPTQQQMQAASQQLAAAAAQLPAQVVAPPGPGQPPAIHVRGGTTYFNPQIQMYGVSPARRTKEPIPIVSPQGTPERPESSDGDQDQAQFYEASESFQYEGVTYEPGQYVQAQEFHPGSPTEGQLTEQQYILLAAPADVSQQQQLYTTEDTGTPAAVLQPTSPSSSFETILKQSGSLDNIKEFRPQQVDTAASQTLAVAVEEEGEVDGHEAEVTEPPMPQSPGQSFTEDDDEETKRLIYVVDSNKDLLAGTYSEEDAGHHSFVKDEEDDQEEDFHPYDDDQSDESDIDFEEGIIASTEQTLNNSRGQSALSPGKESVSEKTTSNQNESSMDKSANEDDAVNTMQDNESLQSEISSKKQLSSSGEVQVVESAESSDDSNNEQSSHHHQERVTTAEEGSESAAAEKTAASTEETQNTITTAVEEQQQSSETESSEGIVAATDQEGETEEGEHHQEETAETQPAGNKAGNIASEEDSDGEQFFEAESESKRENETLGVVNETESNNQTQSAEGETRDLVGDIPSTNEAVNAEETDVEKNGTELEEKSETETTKKDPTETNTGDVRSSEEVSEGDLKLEEDVKLDTGSTAV